MWQTFVYPFLGWIIAQPIVYCFVRFYKPRHKTTLASSNWMPKKEFDKLFDAHTENDKVTSNWVTHTSIDKKGLINYSLAKEPGHALVIGSTGSGKTALLLNPTIQLLARTTDQPSMVLSDPKGELYNTHSKMLSQQGYEVLALNLRDISQSSKWNPLAKIWDLWFVEGTKYEIASSREMALNYLSELASSIFVPKGKDSFWDEGANTIFRFFVVALLEKADEDKDITKEHLNITNIAANIHETTYDDLKDFLDELPRQSKAITIGGKNIRGAENTVNGLFQTCVTTLQIYNDPIIKRVTSSTTLKIDITKPQAIFIIVPDESKAKYPFISLFVAEFYKELIAMASALPTSKLPRRFYFLLDEFGNVPKIPSMDSMITVARSRNIFFMLLLQDYSQLKENYGPNIANTIISNCMYEFFLLTADVETANKFSQKLGEREITTTSRSSSAGGRGSSSSSSESERTRKLIHPDELMRLQMGEFVLSMQRQMPIKSSLDLFWNWKNLVTGRLEKEITDEQEIYDEKHIYNFVLGKPIETLKEYKDSIEKSEWTNQNESTPEQLNTIINDIQVYENDDEEELDE